jgi:PAS domain-containing protein
MKTRTKILTTTTGVMILTAVVATMIDTSFGTNPGATFLFYLGICVLPTLTTLWISLKKFVEKPLQNLKGRLQGNDEIPWESFIDSGTDFREAAELVSSSLRDKIARETEINDRNEVAKMLLDRETLLRATLESTADGILVVRQDGKASHWNARFRRPESVARSGDIRGQSAGAL